MRITIETGADEGGHTAPVTVSTTPPQPTPPALMPSEAPLPTTALTADVPTYNAGPAPALESLGAPESVSVASFESMSPTVTPALRTSTITQPDVSAGPAPFATGE
jgi:hypothetical protein